MCTLLLCTTLLWKAVAAAMIKPEMDVHVQSTPLPVAIPCHSCGFTNAHTGQTRSVRLPSKCLMVHFMNGNLEHIYVYRDYVETSSSVWAAAKTGPEGFEMDNRERWSWLLAWITLPVVSLVCLKCDVNTAYF